MNRRSSIRRHLTFANVASALALFLAIGGGTTAIALRGKNSVDSGDIKNRAVKTRDLANNAATGAKVNESTFTIVPDASELDGISSEEFQLGNGFTLAIAGVINDDAGAGLGRIDLGSTTLEIDCAEPPTPFGLTVRDDVGGVVPNAAAPTDVWIDDDHEVITADGGSFGPGGAAGMDESATKVGLWTADSVVADMEVDLAWDAAEDRCTVVVPITLNLPLDAITPASTAQRPPAPKVSGIETR